MIKVLFHQTALCPISSRAIQKVATVSARYEKKIKGIVEVHVVGEKAIRNLNRRFRGIDNPTDVLSFSWQDELFAGLIGSGTPPFLGQLYLSYSYIYKQARFFRVPPHEEFVRMLVHGLLHLVGHDHIRAGEAHKMFGLQEKIVSVLT